jgi:hypothetical protein
VPRLNLGKLRINNGWAQAHQHRVSSASSCSRANHPVESNEVTIGLVTTAGIYICRDMNRKPMFQKDKRRRKFDIS